MKCSELPDEVPNAICGDNVLLFVRRQLEPVSYKKVIAHFCDALDSESKQVEAKSLLNRVLVKSINSGAIMHCNNYFFAGSHAEDMEGVIDICQSEDMSPDASSISLTSCESMASADIAQNDIFTDANDRSEAIEGVTSENHNQMPVLQLGDKSKAEIMHCVSLKSSVALKRRPDISTKKIVE